MLKRFWTTSVNMVRTFVLIPFVEVRITGIVLMEQKPFLTIFFGFRNYVSVTTVNSPNEITSFLSSNKSKRLPLAWFKVWSKNLSSKSR